MKDIPSLFDVSSSIAFSLSNVNEIPEYGSIIYTVFLDKTEFIYVGIGGLTGKTVQERNPRNRIKQHISGIRSSDQFCIYIQDFYVLPLLLCKPYIPIKGELDRLTKQFIQSRLSYRFLVFQTDDSNAIVRKLEKVLQSGYEKYPKPILNGINP